MIIYKAETVSNNLNSLKSNSMNMIKRKKEEISMDRKFSIRLKDILNTNKKVETIWKFCVKIQFPKLSIHPAARILCLLQSHIRIQNRI